MFSTEKYAWSLLNQGSATFFAQRTSLKSKNFFRIGFKNKDEIQQLKPTFANAFKHRNNRNLRINYVHLRPSAPKVLKSSSPISQNVRKQLGLKLYRYKKCFKTLYLEKYAAR